MSMPAPYTYVVLTETQARLLNKYAPWADKVGLAQMLDEILQGTFLGIFDHIHVTYEAFIGRDLYVGRDAYIARNLYVGGGYGSTGLTIDENGNLITDGVGDFSVGGIVIPYDNPASGDPGTPGATRYGESMGVGYAYFCFASGDWRRVALAAGY